MKENEGVLGTPPAQEMFVRTNELRFVNKSFIIGRYEHWQKTLQQAWEGSNGSKDWRDVEITEIIVL